MATKFTKVTKESKVTKMELEKEAYFRKQAEKLAGRKITDAEFLRYLEMRDKMIYDYLMSN